MKDLLDSYKDTRRETKQSIASLKQKIEVLEFEKSKIMDQEKIALKENQLKKIKDDLSILNSMLSSLTYSIDWMTKGKMPGNLRGIERRAGYEREVSIDPHVMQRYFGCKEVEFGWEIPEQKYGMTIIDKTDKEIIEFALQDLTEKEREIYILFAGKNMSQYKIAEMLYVTRNTVKTTLSRAKRKIKHSLEVHKNMNGDD